MRAAGPAALEGDRPACASPTFADGRRRRAGRQPVARCSRPTAACSTPARRRSPRASATWPPAAPCSSLGFESADHPVEPWMARAVELVPRPRRHACPTASRRSPRRAERRRRRGRRVAERVPAGAVHPRRARALRRDRRDVRDGVHLGPLRRAARRASPRRSSTALHELCGGGWVTCRFTHVYPDGPAPYFSVMAPGRLGSELAQWDEIKAAASEALARRRRHDHPPPRRRPRPRRLVRRQRPEPFGRALRRRQARARPGRHPQPRRARCCRSVGWAPVPHDDPPLHGGARPPTAASASSAAGSCPRRSCPHASTWRPPSGRRGPTPGSGPSSTMRCSNYAGRPSPLTECRNLSERLGLRVLLKREDLNHTGSSQDQQRPRSGPSRPPHGQDAAGGRDRRRPARRGHRHRGGLARASTARCTWAPSTSNARR